MLNTPNVFGEKQLQLYGQRPDVFRSLCAPELRKIITVLSVTQSVCANHTTSMVPYPCSAGEGSPQSIARRAAAREQNGSR